MATEILDFSLLGSPPRGNFMKPKAVEPMIKQDTPLVVPPTPVKPEKTITPRRRKLLWDESRASPNLKLSNPTSKLVNLQVLQSKSSSILPLKQQGLNIQKPIEVGINEVQHTNKLQRKTIRELKKQLKDQKGIIKGLKTQIQSNKIVNMSEVNTVPFWE